MQAYLCTLYTVHLSAHLPIIVLFPPAAKVRVVKKEQEFHNYVIHSVLYLCCFVGVSLHVDKVLSRDHRWVSRDELCTACFFAGRYSIFIPTENVRKHWPEMG